MLNQEAHEPFGVENKLIPCGFFVPKRKERWRRKEGMGKERLVGFLFSGSNRCPIALGLFPLPHSATEAANSPNDRVHTPNLWGALQHTESLGEWVALVGRSQGCPGTKRRLKAI